MQTRYQNAPAAAPTPLDLRDKALNLRESVNSSRARMNAQRESMKVLRLEIERLRAMLEEPRALPVIKEAVVDSAPSTTSFKTDKKSLFRRAAPYALLLAAGIGVQLVPGPGRTAGAAPAAAAAAPTPAPALDDDGGEQQALLLAHDWHVPGDEQALSERLGTDVPPPGAQPEWTAERTGDRTFRVSFRPSGTDVDYAFDVDLSAQRVDPTPETVELISPRLASAQ